MRIEDIGHLLTYNLYLSTKNEGTEACSCLLGNFPQEVSQPVRNDTYFSKKVLFVPCTDVSPIYLTIQV